ncbi:MAG: PilZ domain-containing protein [Cellvibrionaceae bacterium]|nr:PilZ domain-containing protein [Cellvibrionaceae bacterium]
MSKVAMNSRDHRQFIRHPSDIPIEYCFMDKPVCLSDSISDVSLGGLSFHAQDYIQPNQWLHLHIPINEEHFEVDAQVRWCNLSSDKCSYDVGVLFATKSAAFSTRMVEQICHIEHYKKVVLETEGRVLNGDEAAAEWIERFATSFPNG